MYCATVDYSRGRTLHILWNIIEMLLSIQALPLCEGSGTIQVCAFRVRHHKRWSFGHASNGALNSTDSHKGIHEIKMVCPNISKLCLSMQAKSHFVWMNYTTFSICHHGTQRSLTWANAHQFFQAYDGPRSRCSSNFFVQYLSSNVQLAHSHY